VASGLNPWQLPHFHGSNDTTDASTPLVTHSGLCMGLPVSRCPDPICILLKQEIVSSSSVSWKAVLWAG